MLSPHNYYINFYVYCICKIILECTRLSEDVQTDRGCVSYNESDCSLVVA